MKKKYSLQITQDEMVEYAEFFKSMRLSIGLSLEQMAEQIGNVHRTSLSRWEKAMTIPNMDIDVLEKRFREVVKNYKLAQ